MPDTTYVLDLTVTGADLVTVKDDGLGSDTISVLGIYDRAVEISLSYTTSGGQTLTAGGYYYDQYDRPHRLVIQGLIENAIGSNGSDLIEGNEFANRLFGELNLSGPGAADTIRGGAGNDTIHGGVGTDQMFGDADDDMIFGESGADTIFGGTGLDTIEGGIAADNLDGGGDAGDTVSYKTSSAGVRITLAYAAVTTGIGGDAAGDQLSGFFAVMGSAFRDILSDADKSTLPDHANDNAFFGGGGGDLLLMGGGDDTGLGGPGGDGIWGENGNDALDGGNGNDSLHGGPGADTLTGGTGADLFDFRSRNDSIADPEKWDTIADFSAAEGDRINLALIDAVADRSGNQAFHLITTAFLGNAGELRLVAQGNDLLVLGDINGDTQPDIAILLLNVSVLSAADLLL
jgi:serralysin